MSVDRELAEHGVEIRHIQADVDKLVTDLESVKKTLEKINETLAEAKGGWKVLMMLGGAGGVLGAAVTQFVHHWLGK